MGSRKVSTSRVTTEIKSSPREVSSLAERVNGRKAPKGPQSQGELKESRSHSSVTADAIMSLRLPSEVAVLSSACLLA